MKHNIINRAVALLLALVCIMGILPLSAFAATGLSSAPSSITQKSSDYMKIGGHSVRYKAASSVINNVGLPYVFDEQVTVPGMDAPVRALCAYQKGTLGPGANGQKWNFKNEVNSASLKVLLTYIYAHTYGNFTDAGNAIGLEHWNNYWSDIWFMVAQAASWLYEHGAILDVNSNREGFIEQISEEFIAAMKLYHQTYGQSSWITNWDSIGTHSIIDSKDGGVTGYSAYDYVSTGVNLVLEHSDYYPNYHLWMYEWDKSQPWKLAGQSGVPMQHLLIAVPDPEVPTSDTVQLTVKKLEAGTNKPMSGVTFTIKSADEDGDFSVTRQTGADGTITLTDEADDLKPGQYLITEDAVPEGYVAQTASQVVTVMPNGSANSEFTFYNEPNKKEGDGSIRKVDADNPTVGIAGAVIRITSVLLDDGGSFVSEYTTGDGGYIPKDQLDFSKLPTGSYIAEEITPPEGYILSSDIAKTKQAFVWDGEHDISLIFENSSKVKVQLKKVDESGQPLPGAIFVVLRDGQIIATEETQADGTITISNVTEGYYEFREVSAPAGFDCDRSPVGVHINAEDLQGEQTIVVEKMNHHKRSLTISKRNTETGDPVPGTSFHIRGINNGYENDVVTEANGKVTLSDMPSGCYEVEETDVPAPYILDTNNRKTVWIDAEKDQDVVVEFVNSTKPGLRLMKIDQQTGEPLSGVQFRIREVNGSYNELLFTDKDGLIVLEGMNPGAYTIQETKPKNGWVADDTIHTVYLEENKTTTIELSNLRKPDLFVKKVDSVTGSSIEGVKFQIWRGSDDTKTGEYNDLGVFYTDAQGQIHLERQETGWYKIKELEPAPGYTIKQPDTQEIYMAAGKNYTVTFENTPKNAIIVEKYDSVTHQALPGCTFQLRYLSGSSGTGGTVIGQKVTGDNGIAMWTGLEPGTYVVEEVDPADGYSIINSSETVFIADNGEQSVVTVRFDNMPDGNLLIRKVCATNPSITLQNAEFKIMYADGRLIGDSNGIYRTDENGEIRIEGLEPGKSVIVTEVKAPAGFIIDTQSQTIQIKEGRTVSMTFKNQPKGKLIIQKRDSQTGEVLPGAEFRVTTAAGCEVGLDGVIGTSSLTQNGIFTTDSQGEIRITNLAPGAYVINEIKAPDGYVIDTPSTNVVIGTGGDTQTVIIKDTKKGGLVVEKYDSVTRQPLSGARFKIMMSNGELTADNEGLTSSNGLYTTDINGQIVLSKLLPGTYVVTEDKAPDNYRKDPTPQTVVVNAGDTQTLRFYDDPLCTLTILKRDAVTKNPLRGAEFLVTDSSGFVIGPNHGLYTTGTDGTVTVTGLTPDSTVVVSEKRAPTGYILDETPKNIVVRSGVANSLIFDNEPGTTLIIRKFIEGTENEPLSGVAFKVVDGAGAAVGPDDGVYYTDKAGEIVLDGIEPGTTVNAREIKTVEGYVLDGTPQDIKIVGGRVQQLTFWNKQAGTLVIQKKDKVSGALIPGAQFQLTYANGGFVDNDNGHLSSNGIYTTDDNGEIRISGIIGTIVAKEIKAAPGYTIDQATQTQTVTVNPMDTQTLVFLNEPLCSLTLTKLDSVTGKPVPNTTFTVKDGSGNVLGRYTTGKDGTVTVTGLIPNSTVVVTETNVPDGYVLDSTPKTITVKNGAGNSVTTGGTVTGTGNGTGNDLTFENDPKMTLTIHKYIEGTANEPLAGVAFKVTDGSGAAVGTGDGVYYTDKEGEIKVTGIEPGTTLTVRETKTVEGFVLDGTPKTVQVKAGQPAPELTFWNKRDCTLTILKQSTSKDPLPGAVFHVTDEDGAAIGTNNGRYTSDRNGLITITGLQPGQVLIVTEEKAPNGYVRDMTPKTIKIKQDVANSLIFENAKAGSLVINKRSSADKKTPLEDVTFKITTTSGEFLPDENGKISSNGLYYTDENGQIVLKSVVGTLVVTEVATIDGYVISDANRTQTVEVKPDDTQTLYFYNDPLCSLTITKLDSVTGKPVPNTVFAVKDGNGNLLGRYTTGQDGTVTVTGLIPNSTVVVTEEKVPAGYVLNTTPQTIIVRNGTGNTLTSGSNTTGTTVGGTTSTGTGNGLTFENDPTMTLTIHKYIEGSKNEPLAGVTFKLVDGSGTPVGPGDGTFVTDSKGEIVVEGLEPGTTITAREIKTVEGYVLDGTPKSVKIKAGEGAPELTFWNARAGELIIRKLDSVTKQPLAGVEFELTYAGGYVDNADGHLSSNGLYTTDAHGEIHISGVTGTIVVKETRTIDGYTIDEATRTQTVKVNPQDTQTLTFYNNPKQALTIQKYVDGTTDPIQGVHFLVTDSSGQYVGPDNGEYITDKNGRITITDLTPGTTITAKETKTVSGYVLDTTPQSILIKQGVAQTLTFFNKSEGGLELIKVNESDTTQRISGVTFEIRKKDGGLIDTVTTGEDGRVHVNLDAGDYYAVETECPKEFKLDNTPHYFTVKDGKTTTLTVKNKPFSGILIHKTDSVTGEGLYSVTFLLYDSKNTPIGQYTSDNSGYVYIEGLTDGGRYYLRELENEGYVPDNQMKTVYVKAGETTLIEWKNTPITGQIQITKTSEDYNSMNGWPTGTPIPGTEFEIYHYRTGNLVDTVRTDKNGVAASKPLPLGRYKIVESKAADFYGLDKTPIDVEIEHAGQIVKVAMTNKALSTNVSIKKTGYAEVMPGQNIRYTFSEIGNNSTTALTSFYWRDTLPVTAVRLAKIYTGTYNAAGNYKIVYKTNLSNGEYRTMYDNLSTAKNYTLDASPVALGLASNEYVTEFMLVFGVVPANFRQVEAPKVDCTVLKTVKGGSQFTNIADVGGVYNGQWIQAVTRWTTKVYGKPVVPSLPKTGY